MTPSEWYAGETALKELRNAATALAVRNSVAIDDGATRRGKEIDRIKTAIEDVESGNRLFSDNAKSVAEQIARIQADIDSVDADLSAAKGIASVAADAVAGGIQGAGFGLGFALVLLVVGYIVFMRATR